MGVGWYPEITQQDLVWPCGFCALVSLGEQGIARNRQLLAVSPWQSSAVGL